MFNTTDHTNLEYLFKHWWGITECAADHTCFANPDSCAAVDDHN